ncbi:hypothetical protein [Microbacterium sp. VKM Ac-2923]|uniref:hypothetical protein n=1 Tax=Microbacterium sp. VKM Ac-2923 TaxID=2929476 RepID=UPI001FB2D67C|nr:hypothetical protein [Microbacterium sp. VKM Ac-2923]MCJ1709272.1 hypothetical protein [Microbacterium sp. VKM Ac-2923]
MRRRKDQAYGRYESPMVDSAATVAKVEILRTDGWTWEQIATAAGFKLKAQAQMIVNRRSSKVHRKTEAAVLAITDRPASPPRATVDPTGTRRRLYALARLGWSWTAIAEESGYGWTVKFVSHTAVGGKSVMLKTADAVREVYERLADTPPPAGGPSTRAKNYAIAHGWHAPIEWLDVDMDDPEAEPTPLEESEPGWAVAEAAHLYALGESSVQAAAQIGRDPSVLARLARRHGRKDLASWLGESARAA